MIRGVPYDEELEYIEIASTGTFRVPTGLVLPASGVFEIRVDAYVPTGARGNNTFVSRYSSGGYGFILSVRNGKPDLWLAGSYSLPSTVYGERHLFTLSGDGTETWTLACDGATRTINRGSNWDKGTKTISLFNPSDRFNEQAAPGDRIYSIKFIFDGEVVRDFIPVKALGVARLYDRKTRTFLVNEGTGVFVAGPVASTPLMGVHMYQTANLWKWPTQATTGSANPTTVWTPVLGVVYPRVASNGYVNNTYPYDPFVAGPKTILSVCNTGYGAAVFRALPPGKYKISADISLYSGSAVTTSTATIYAMDYAPSSGQWVLSGLTSSGNKPLGIISVSFTVEPDHLVAIVFFSGVQNVSILVKDVSLIEEPLP